MSGLFGGILELVHQVGGAVLYVLIGRKADSEDAVARAVKLILGGLLVGLVVGALLFVLLPEFQGLRPRYYGDTRQSPLERKVIICFLVAPAACVVGTWILEGIRRAIND